MILYHINQLSSLQVGDVITPCFGGSSDYCENLLIRHAARKLFPDGLANFGARILLPITSGEALRCQLTEWIFEYVRLSKFDHLPSRFTSLYASMSIKDSVTWISQVEADVSKLQLLEIETDIAYIADAHLLDHNTASSPAHSASPVLHPQEPLQRQDQSWTFPAQLVASALRYWESIVCMPQAEDARRLRPDCVDLANTFSKPEVLLPLPVRVVGVVPRSKWENYLR